MWYKKFSRAIVRSIFNMEELEKLEIDKAVKVKRVSQSLGKGLFDVMYESIGIGNRHYPTF